MLESKPRTQKATAGSVFDRLYKAQTAASRGRQKTQRAAAKAWNPTPRNVDVVHRTPSKTLSTDDCSKIFTRLHITSTVSNASKRAKPWHPTTPANTTRSPLRRTPAKTPSTKAGEEFVYSPRMKPLTKLTFKSKYHPGLGLEVVEPIKLGNQFFQRFCEYENCEIDSEQIAKDIIVAFFKKDFPAGRHWEMHDPEVVKKRENVFDVTMSATYDWNGRSQLASAKGAVKFLGKTKEVRVENYIYDISKS